MTKVHDTLVAARALIADPERWTQGAWARDEEGGPVGTLSPAAVCFCAQGALVHVSRSGHERALEALSVAAGRRPTVVNDFDGHAAVLEMYDRAIEATA